MEISRSVTCDIMASHSVTYHPTQVNTPALPQAYMYMPVLDLPTPEGWKAELT